MMGIDEYWKVADVAKRLRVSSKWVYNRVQENEIPHRRIGNLLRFVPAEIEAWIDGTAPAYVHGVWR